MKEGYEVVELYREIGREFRALGAEKVILLHSRTDAKEPKNMVMEIAVEGFVEKEKLLQRNRDLWPWIEMEITVLDENSPAALVQEIFEDGILL